MVKEDFLLSHIFLLKTKILYLATLFRIWYFFKLLMPNQKENYPNDINGYDTIIYKFSLKSSSVFIQVHTIIL